MTTIVQANDPCPRCHRGSMVRAIPQFPYNPRPAETLRCTDCKRYVYIVKETGYPPLEVWLSDETIDETFADVVERLRKEQRDADTK